MTGIFYRSEAHKARFLASLQQLGKVYDGKADQEYSAALYILTSSHSTWEKASDYASRDGIDFEALLKERDFSGGYGVLIELAGNLFNGNTPTEPLELMRLDDSNFIVALNALQLRRASFSIDDLK
jgi:Family of unknown function (DUF6075)